MLEVVGPALPDDACLLVLDWYGGHGDTTAGVDPSRAGAPAADRGRPARGTAHEAL